MLRRTIPFTLDPPPYTQSSLLRAQRLLPCSAAVLILLSLALAEAAEGTKPAPAGKTAKENVLSALVRAATATVEASLTVFTRTFPENPVQSVDDKHVVPWTKSTVKSQANLTNDLTVKFALSGAYSGYDDELQGVFASPDSEKAYARYVDFKELFLRYDQSAFAVIVGKAPIPVGLSTLYRPTNRYQTVNTANPMHPDDLGAWQVSLDSFLGDKTLGLSVLPFEERSPSPYGSSRWLGEVGGSVDRVLPSLASGTSLTGGAAGLTVPGGASARVVFRNRPGYLLRFSGVSTGFDYFSTVHYGPSNFFTIQNPPEGEFIAERPAAVTFSGGGATTRGALEVHGESLYQLTDGNDDQDFVKYVVGAIYRETKLAERIGFDEIAPVVEYAGEWVTDEQDNPGLTVNSSTSRPLRNSLLFKVDLMPNDKITCVVAGIRNFTSEDYAQLIGVEYRPNYNLTLKVSAVLFGGPQDAPFGQWDRNDHVEFRVIRTF